MRVLLQRVSQAQVTVNGEITGRIGKGLLLLVGVKDDDNEDVTDWMVGKIARLRVFDDADGKMNLSVQDVKGAALAISEFTLYGDTNKGNRPSYVHAARPEKAAPLYDRFCERLGDAIGSKVEKGVFGAHMDVELTNDGPVTVIIEK